MSAKTVLVVSDLHVGHVHGLWVPGFPGPWENDIGLNPGQKYLWECWKDLTAEVRRKKPDVVVVNGDLIDGEQRRQMGSEASTTVRAAQQKVATKLLEPVVSACGVVYGIRGSPYHDGPNGIDIEPIMSSLGAVGPFEGYHSWPLLDLDIDGVVINFMHAIGVRSGQYRLTAHDAEGQQAALRGKEGYVPIADCVVRSHIHFFGHTESPKHHVVTSPCWQLQTEYMRRHSAYRMMPDIGALFIDVDPEAKRQGEDPIHIHKRLYKLPTRKVSRLKTA